MRFRSWWATVEAALRGLFKNSDFVSMWRHLAGSTTTAAIITGAPRAFLQYVREAREELKKVAWPSRETTVRYTILVIVASIVFGVVTGGVDYLLTWVLETLLF